MFAVLKTGGKQYRVATGDVLRVEKLACEAGETVQFNDVMMLGGDTVSVGTPLVAGAAVQADVIDQIRGEKLIHFVKRRRKHGSQRTKGHRQYLTLLRVTDILTSGADATGVKAAIGAGSAPRPATEAGLGVPRTATKEAKVAAAAKRGKASKAPKAPKPAPDAAPAEAAAPEAEDNTTRNATIAGAAVAGIAAVAAGVAVATGVIGGGKGEKPGNLLDEARGGKPDELRKIGGVGPKLEATLHANGVFHFDQIAAWGPEEVAYMDDRLSFKGRIERDGWIDQAKTFAAEQE